MHLYLYHYGAVELIFFFYCNFLCNCNKSSVIFCMILEQGREGFPLNMFYLLLRNSNVSISLTKYLALLENHTDCTLVSKILPNCFIITGNNMYTRNPLKIMMYMYSLCIRLLASRVSFLCTKSIHVPLD